MIYHVFIPAVECAVCTTELFLDNGTFWPVLKLLQRLMGLFGSPHIEGSSTSIYLFNGLLRTWSSQVPLKTAKYIPSTVSSAV